MLEILLNLIFRPYNAYCIYIGSNSGEQFRQSVQRVVNCYKETFPETTLFLAQGVQDVHWGTYSLIEADLICMEQLLQHNQ